MKKLELSRYLQSLPLKGDWILVAHPFHLTRMIMDKNLFDSLHLFKDRPLSEQDFCDLANKAQPVAQKIFNSFEKNFFIVESGEEEALKKNVLNQAMNSKFVTRQMWDAPTPRTSESFSSRLPVVSKELKNLNVALLGGCLVQLTSDALKALGPQYGFDVRVISSWVSEIDSIDFENVQILVFQPGVLQVLGPLWDDLVFIKDQEKKERLENIKNFISVYIEKLKPLAKGKLLLVQGIASPQISPYGRADFRFDLSFDEIVDEINRHIKSIISKNQNIFFIDENRLASNIGKSILMDDMLNSYGHHGPIDFIEHLTSPHKVETKDEPELDSKTVHIAQLLAAEYLDCYLIWKGTAKIKCVIADLDNTIWKGVVGETTPVIADFYGGIHQALKIVKERGVLLATCSKNNEADVLKFWNEFMGQNHEKWLLRPSDFVMHKINWEHKTKNIAQIMKALELGEDAVLFIDDHPLEREAVRQTFPKIRVLGENLRGIRGALLNDPCLQFNSLSQEAQSRTEMTKAQLRRDDFKEKSLDERSFLKSVDVRLTITQLKSDRYLQRLVELLQRTNQFNTTLARYDLETLQALISQPNTFVYAGQVTDRFAQYGIVASCIIREGEIENVAVSCRVLALKVAEPFVNAALNHCRPKTPVRGRIVEGERNQPSRDLYQKLGFKNVDNGLFRLETNDFPRPVDSELYKVTICTEEEL